MAYYPVTSTLGGWQVRPDTVTSPPIATFTDEADARAFGAFKERQSAARVEHARAMDAHACAARVDDAFQLSGLGA